MKPPLSLVLFLVLSFNAYSNDFLSRVKDVYSETDTNFDLDCYYSRNKTWKLITPQGETTRSGDLIVRNFSIESDDGAVPILFKVTRENKLIVYEIILDGIHVIKNKVSKREFYLGPLRDKNFESKFETTKISCSINFAYALPFVLNSSDYHFSVHPQKTYDWQNRLTSGIESYLSDENYQSVIFLENGNGRGNLVNINNFFNNVLPTLPTYPFTSHLVNVPENTSYIVSPAGNNRFVIPDVKEINITFTGGNHNYCVWNVARHVLEDLMQSKSNPRINFIYPTELLVAQIRGVEGLRIDFLKKDINKSNLLKDLLSTSEAQKSYHESYIDYFIRYLAEEYKAMYRSYTVLYSAPGYHKEIVLQGNGQRDLVVQFRYY